MNPIYLETVRTLLVSTQPQIFIRHKSIFGAVAGYVDGKIFISCGQFGIALKLPSKILLEISKEKGVKPFKYFPNGHIKKNYAILPMDILQNKSQFKKLINESLQFTLALQQKNRKN